MLINISKPLGSFLILALVLCACGGQPATSQPQPSISEPQPTASATYPPASPTPELSSSEVPATLSPASAALTMEEHALKRNTMVGEEVVSVPLDGDWEEIRAVHAEQREERFPREVYTGNSLQVGDKLIHWEYQYGTTPQPDGTVLQDIEIRIFENEDLLLTIPMGKAQPVSPVWGFWAVDDSWYLETVASSEKPKEDPNVIEIESVGDIYQDGESLNQREGYEESFGFQTIAGRPFYFYQRDGLLGYFFDGSEYPLGYEEIFHYGCCSGAAYNPQMAQRMVAFYGTKAGQLYYVELGVFN